MKSLRQLLIVGVIGLGACAGAASAQSTCPDVNDDQSVGMADLLSVIAAWGAGAGHPADVVTPSGVGMSDLLAVISGWGPCPPDPGINATPIWCEDWSLVNYSRRTDGYAAGTNCENMQFRNDKYVSPTWSHRSRVSCAASGSHRGYGGLRFQGDVMLPNFGTPSTAGISAPHGLAVTFWSWLDTPYTFNSSKWLSLMTVTHDCSNNWTSVLCLNIDDSSMRVKPVHVSTVTYEPNAPAFPLRQWVRTTVYVNYNTGQMHVWQNGTKVVSATFSRPVNTMCQWHWGLYASGPNNDVTLFEDDISIMRLNEPWTNFQLEPWDPDVFTACSLN